MINYFNIVFISSLLILVSSSGLRHKKALQVPTERVNNGDFQKGQEGWISDDFEVGPGNVYYNSQWQSGTTINELDAWRGNTVIKQVVTLDLAGSVTLTWDAANREGYSSDSNRYSVWWNGNKVDYQYFDYVIHHETLNLIGNAGENTLEFHGEGQNDTVGQTISKISLLASNAPAPSGGNSDECS